MARYTVKYLRGPMRTIGLPTVEPPLIERGGPAVEFDEEAYTAFKAFVGRLGPFAVDGSKGSYGDLDYDECFDVGMFRSDADDVEDDDVEEEEEEEEEDVNVEITSSGNIGIGTSPPSHVFPVTESEAPEPQTVPELHTWLADRGIAYSMRLGIKKLQALYAENR